jgi:F420-non-reducing hydrogenase iron-sulfur subunit
MTVKRITFLQKLLAFMGLEGRLHLEWISSAEAQKFVQVITDFTEKIRRLGPNPLRVSAGGQPAAEWKAAADLGKRTAVQNKVEEVTCED